jgi:hypothetical protein
VLGDWEGVGPHGLPFSFSLARVHGRITISDLTTGDPLYCPGRLEPTNAYAYPRQPTSVQARCRSCKSAGNREILIRVGRGTPFEPQWDGRLLGPRRATLSTPAPTNQPRGCGWSSKRLTWRLAPARHVTVRPGSWSGTLSVPGGSGTVSVTVMPSGRIVQLFKVLGGCPSGGGSFSVGPAKVGDFIAADGSFEDANRPSSFQGRFGADGSLTGTVTASLPESCGASSFAFVAHRG